MVLGDGRGGPALGVSEEAVTLYRELVGLNRDAYLPNLATSLWMFALVRQTLGTETTIGSRSG